MTLIGYGKPDVIAEGTNDDIDTAEEDIVTVTDGNRLTFSQLSIAVTMDRGSHTTVDLRVYYRDEVGGTWFQVPKQNTSTGLVEDFYYQFDSNTPTEVLLDLPISAAFAMKVTGQGTGGANGDVTVRLLGRNN